MEFLNKIRKHSVTFIRNESEYKVHGTAVLVKIKDLHILVSAAHVFDDFEELKIPLHQGEFMFKPGGEIITNVPNGDRKNDNIDIGILILDQESIKEISTSYTFLEENRILINHNFSNNENYLFFGFPSTWSKKSISRKSFHIRPFFHNTNIADKAEYNKFGKKDFINIIVDYDRKKTINVKSNSINFGPNLFGMSGCGLWHIHENHEISLVAILTDWPKENRTRVIGTRFDIVTEVLRNKYKLDFEVSNLFSLK